MITLLPKDVLQLCLLASPDVQTFAAWRLTCKHFANLGKFVMDKIFTKFAREKRWVVGEVHYLSTVLPNGLAHGPYEEKTSTYSITYNACTKLVGDKFVSFKGLSNYHNQGKLTTQDYHNSWGKLVWVLTWHTKSSCFITYDDQELRHGVIETKWLDGKLESRESWYHGACHWSQRWYKNGQLAEEWLHTGICQRWFENGTLSSHRFLVEGIEEGPAAVYHDNGQLYQWRNFVNGKTHGSLFVWADTGCLISLTLYELDRITQSDHFGFDGTLISRTKLDLNGDGTYEEWHHNGLVSQRGYYLNNLRSGVWTVWNPDGTFRYTVPYTNGKPHGIGLTHFAS
jgi:antitoxin component YwqK of YwqJK toxin-antitoxin module